MFLLVPLLRDFVLGFALFLAAQALACRALGLRGAFRLRDARTQGAPPLWKRLAARSCGVAAAYLLSAGLIAWGSSLMEVETARIRVMEGYPAQRAGLQDGDLVVAVDGEPLHGFQALRTRLQGPRPPGTPVRLTLERSGARREVSVPPGEGGRIGVMALGESGRMRGSEALRRGLEGPWRALGGWVRLPSAWRARDPAASPVVRSSSALAQQMSQSRGAMILLSLGLEFSLVWPMALLYAAGLTLAEQRRLRSAPAPALLP